MRSLFRFLAKNYFFLLFVVLETICLGMVVKYNNYQKVKFLNSSNAFIAKTYEIFNTFSGFFHLQQVNTELAAENASLKNELEKLAAREAKEGLDSIAIDSVTYAFIPAKVINNSVNKQNNYITLNKGRKDGVRTDMGIIGPDGIVGIITNISDHYSTGPTLLNKKWKVSAKIKKNNYFGSLVWDGINFQHAKLNEIPFHVDPAVGDTIVTSGYSSYFPEGTMIGQIESFDHGSGDNFYDITVVLSTNFMTLSHVEIIKNYYANELINLQKQNTDD